MATGIVRRASVLIASVAVALAAASCSNSSSDSSGSGKTFTVVAVLGISAPGQLANVFKAERDGLLAAASVINADGGILGHKVKVDVLDDGGDPSKGVGLLQERLQGENKPNLVIPGELSSEGLAYVPLTTRAKVISIGVPSDISLVDVKKYPYNFNQAVPNAVYAQQAIDWAEGKGATKVATLLPSSAFGDDVLGGLKKSAASAGVALVTQRYPATALDMSSQLQSLKASGATALVLAPNGAEPVYILQGRSKLAWDVPTLCTDSCPSTSISTISPTSPEARDVSIVAPSIAHYDRAVQQASTGPAAVFLVAVKKQTKGQIASSMNLYGFGYDQIMLCAQAAKAKGDITTDALKSGLESLKPDGAKWIMFKNYSYTAGNHAPSIGADSLSTFPVSAIKNGQFGAP